MNSDETTAFLRRLLKVSPPLLVMVIVSLLSNQYQTKRY
jgi:hypothetical protein